MKYLVFLLGLFMCINAKAQFPGGTDTLRRFNNRFIDNDAKKAFTNLRLHNLLAGIIDQIDSAAGGGSISLGLDTLWAQNDSTLIYRKNGLFYTVIVRGATGAGLIYRVPFSDGAHLTNDSNFLFDKSQGADASRLIVGPTTISSGGLAKINATSDNMNALALTSYGTGLNTILFRRARGSIASPTGLLIDDDLFNLSGRGYTGSLWTGSKAAIYGRASQNWTDTTNGTRLYFATTTNDSVTMETRMIMDDSVQIRPVISSIFDSIAAFRGSGNGLNTILKVPFSGNSFIQNQFSSAQSGSFYIDSLGKIRYLEVDSFATFIPITTPAYQEGRLYYDNTNKTFSVLDDITGTSVQLSQETILRARNNTGSTILEPNAVYLTGAIGQNPTVALAQANSVATSRVVGLATNDIANNTVGKITTFGLINNINTSAFTEGDELFLSPTTAGGLTNVEPAAPNLSIFIGRCVTSHVSTGKILVDPDKVVNKNFANADLTWTANRSHNAANFTTTIDSIKTLNLIGRGLGFQGKKRFNQLYMDATNSQDLSDFMFLRHVWRKGADDGDSAVQRLVYNGNTGLKLESINNIFGESSKVFLNFDIATIQGSGLARLLGGDSVVIGNALPKSSADSLFSVGPWSSTLKANTVYKVPVSGLSTSPGGSDTHVQFNNSGVFGGSNKMTWDNSGNVFTVTGDGTADNGYIYVLNPNGEASFTYSNFIVSTNTTGESPQFEAQNNLSKSITVSMGANNGQATIATNDSITISAAHKTQLKAERILLVADDSIRIKAPGQATADSLFASVNYQNVGGVSTSKIVKIPLPQSFAQTATATVSATGTETTLIGSGSGSLVIPSSDWVIGKTYECKIHGYLDTDGSNPAQFNFRLKLGSTTIAATGNMSQGAGVSDRTFEAVLTFTARTVSSTGTIFTMGHFINDNDGINKFDNGTSTSTLDMTGSLTLNLTVQMTDGSAGNNANVSVLTFKAIN